MFVVRKNKSITFSPLGTKLYFHVNSLRKNYIVLTFNKAALSCDCKPRSTSYLILVVQFDLLPSHRRHSPSAFAVFCRSWWSIHHPRASRKRQFPIPELLINLIYVLWGYIFSRAKLIAINFSNLMCWVWFLMHNSYKASYILFVTGLCKINPPPSPCKKY